MLRPQSEGEDDDSPLVYERGAGSKPENTIIRRVKEVDDSAHLPLLATVNEEEEKSSILGNTKSVTTTPKDK